MARWLVSSWQVIVLAIGLAGLTRPWSYATCVMTLHCQIEAPKACGSHAGLDSGLGMVGWSALGERLTSWHHIIHTALSIAMHKQLLICS